MAIVGARAWVNDAGTLKRRAGIPLDTGPTDPGGPVVPSARTFATPFGEYEGTVPNGALYVSPSGSDSSTTGSLGSPFATVDKALSVVPTGGTIVLRGGTSAASAVWHKMGRVRAQLSGSVAIAISRAGVTIMNAPGEAVGFDGSNVITGFTRDATSGFWWRSWTPFDWSPQYVTSQYGTATYTTAISTDDWTTLDGSDPGGNASQDIYWQFIDTAPNTLYGAAGRPERTWINGLQQFHVAKFAQLQPGRMFIDAKTNRLWLGSDPTGKVVEATVQQKLFNFLGADQAMLGLGLRRYAGSQPQGGVIQLHRPRFDFSHNYCVDNAMTPLSFVGDLSGIAPYDSQATNNTFIRSKNIHIRGSQVDRVLIEGNDFLNGNDGGFNPAPASGAVKFTYLQDTKILNNRFRNATTADAPWTGHGKFVWFDADVLRPVVAGNEFYGSGQRTIVMELTNGATVFNNLSVQDGTEFVGLVDAGGTGTGTPRVWNNTVVNTGSKRGAPETIVTLTYQSNGVIHTVRDARYPRVRDGSVPDYVFDKRYFTTQDPSVPAFEPFPSSGTTPRALSIRNNIIVGANVRAVQFDEEQKTGTAAESYTVTGRSSDYNLVQIADSFTTGTGYVNEGVMSLDNTTTQVAANTITAIRALGFETNGQVYAATAPDILDASYNLKDSTQHATAAALPADLAALASQPTGAKRFGSFVTSP